MNCFERNSGLGTANLELPHAKQRRLICTLSGNFAKKQTKTPHLSKKAILKESDQIRPQPPIPMNFDPLSA